MVQKYVVELLDDIDGSAATDSINFSLDGVNYVIDLSDEHINELRTALDPYLAAARKADFSAKTTKSTSSSSSASSTSGTKRSDLSDVRAWANENGHTVSSRGRIPQSVLEAYDAR